MEKDYVFPDLSNLNGEGHHIIAEPKFIKNEFHSFIDELNKNPINNNKILILSSENFSLFRILVSPILLIFPKDLVIL
tara:strand:+ start:36 stop:269 length:234 start_codon:yes stop_codon:yes gene_type:complete